MAMNPLWRKTLAAMAASSSRSGRGGGSGAALLFADIAFDFRAAAGAIRRRPRRCARGWPAACCAGAAGLLAAMLAAQDAELRRRPHPLGRLRRRRAGPGHAHRPQAARADAAGRRGAAGGAARRHRGDRHAGAPRRRSRRAGTLSAARGGAAAARPSTCCSTPCCASSLPTRPPGCAPGNLVDTAALPGGARAALQDALKAVRSFAEHPPRPTSPGRSGEGRAQKCSAFSAMRSAMRLRQARSAGAARRAPRRATSRLIQSAAVARASPSASWRCSITSPRPAAEPVERDVRLPRVEPARQHHRAHGRVGQARRAAAAPP